MKKKTKKEKLQQSNKKRTSKVNPTNTKLERELFQQQFQRVIGIDEVGRGCWAGPVYVGAFVYTKIQSPIKYVTDSKLLTAEIRENLSRKLIKSEYKVVVGEVTQINKIGIGRTIEDLIARIIEFYYDESTFFLIDGHFARKFGRNTRQIIKGDRLHYSIAAASIIAKVARDSFMIRISKQYPGYKFGINKGYATKVHRLAIQTNGISEIHRTSFSPLKLMLEQYSLQIP